MHRETTGTGAPLWVIENTSREQIRIKCYGHTVSRSPGGPSRSDRAPAIPRCPLARHRSSAASKGRKVRIITQNYMAKLPFVRLQPRDFRAIYFASGISPCKAHHRE